MRDCRVCHTLMSVPGKSGPATCPACRRLKYLVAKRRYQHSPKGIAAIRAREGRADVCEQRRAAAASPQGRRNQAKYAATAKGRATRRKISRKYGASEHGKQKAAERHLATKDLPERIAQKRRAALAYALSAKIVAKKRRDYARRKAAIVKERPFTAEAWENMVLRHHHRCYYCRQERPLTLDHVMPLTKGGRHVEENIVPACRSCNSRKNNRIVLLC